MNGQELANYVEKDNLQFSQVYIPSLSVPWAILQLGI